MNFGKLPDNNKNKPANFVLRHSEDDQRDWHFIFAFNAIILGVALLLWFGVMYYGLVALEAVR